MTTDIDFFPIALHTRETVWDMLDLPHDVAPYVRIAHAADVEPGDVILGDAQVGCRFEGWLCTPYLAAPAEHDQAECWECRHNMANYRPRKPGPKATRQAIKNYGHMLDAVEYARRHLDGAVVDLAPGVHAHVNDMIVIIPAAFAAGVPAVAAYQAYITNARAARHAA